MPKQYQSKRVPRKEIMQYLQDQYEQANYDLKMADSATERLVQLKIIELTCKMMKAVNSW